MNLVKQKKTPMWIEENHQLKRSFEFRDFTEAFAFMTKVAVVAEKMNHHPYWSNAYNKVSIMLYTHDANDSITVKDLQLSEEIDSIYDKQ
jgi:4a-hydroxytetrahydrobiopterin dehydratase